MAPLNVNNSSATGAAESALILKDGDVLRKQAAGARGIPLGDALATLAPSEVKAAQVAEPEGPLANAVEVSKLLNQGVLKEIPPAFVFPPDKRSTVGHDEFFDDQDIPTIDLSPALTKDPTRVEKLISEIAAACETNGFFHLVGHGIPEQLMKDVQAHGRKLFNLSLDQKLKGSIAAGVTKQRRGYSASPKTVSPSPALIWQEGFTLIGDKSGQVDVESYAEKIWPNDIEQRESFSHVFQEYAGYSMRLAVLLKDLLIKALKADPKHFVPYFEEPTQVLHLSWYPPSPSPLEVMGLNPHYDIGFLTLIAQDHVPGLQLRGKDGRWFSVRPVPGALCFNVADTLQALSNGRFKSNLHRVMVNKEKSRLSVTTFLSAAFDKTIEPAPELVDQEHPQLYRPYTLAEYMTTIRAEGLDSISNCGHLLDFVKLHSSSDSSSPS